MIEKYKKTSGVLISPDTWSALCPVCDMGMVWRGIFEHDHVYICPYCKWDYQINHLYNPDGSEVK